MTQKVVTMAAVGGIQRDGTLLASTQYVDGEWVRFQRGLPRKIGGYKGIFLNASDISRGMAMTAVDGLNYVVSGNSSALQQWITDSDDGIGSGPYSYTLNNFTANANNLWQFDIGYDSTGNGTNNLVAHPGQNLKNITSTVNTPVLYGIFPSTINNLTLSKVGVFTAAATTNSTTTLTLAALNVRVGAGQTITGTGIPANTTVVSVTGTTVIMSAAATSSASITATFDNNIAVSGGCVVIHPYLFVYGNNGLIQNSSAGDFANWVAADANANNVATGKIIRGLPIRGGSTSPSGLFWAADALIRVSFAPSSSGGQNYFWSYDLVSSQTSVMSSNSIIEYDGIFYWVGVDRFLSYNGVVQEIPNSTNSNHFFDNINFAQRQKVWATKVPRFGEIWWFYPRGDATECTDAIIYNVRDKIWYDAGEAVGARRSAGVFSEVFPKPIWAGNETLTSAIYTGTVTGNTLTVTEIEFGSVNVGQIINGTGVPPNMVITGFGTGAGGTGTYTVSNPSGAFVVSTVLTVQSCVLWQHETGNDAVYLSNIDAIRSHFETPNMGAMTGLVGSEQQPGDNMWTRIERVEPDFIQSGTMQVTVTGKGYADDVDQPSVPYNFEPDTLKIDMREQRREMRLKFESNTFNGSYQTGKVLLSITTGDTRGTGNP